MATSQGLLIRLLCEPILWSGRLVKFDTHGRMQVKCFQWELARRQPRCAHRIRTATSWPWETYCECEICECVSKWGKTEFLKLNNKQTLSFNSWKNNSYLAATNWQQLLLWWSSGAHNWRCTPDWRDGERERGEPVRDHGGGRGARLFEVISRWGSGAEVGVSWELLCGLSLLT